MKHLHRLLSFFNRAHSHKPKPPALICLSIVNDLGDLHHSGHLNRHQHPKPTDEQPSEMKSLPMSPIPFHHLRTATRALNPILRFPRPLFASTMSASADPKLDEFLDYMEKLKNYERLGVPKGAGTDSGDGFDLGRMRRLLQRLGDPHTQFKAIHIAGTKGKGSTAAFVSNILREEGYNVGCYTSPHLLTIRERISLGRNGDPISAVVLRNLFNQLKGILDQSIELESGALTHFEVFTALAFSSFSQENVDFAIIEAGLGGARDATNVLHSTELATSVITSIGEEHLAALGGSLESIAIAKSGIIKHGRPVVIGGPFEPQIERIIRDKAASMDSQVVSACDPGIYSVVKCMGQEDEKFHQICDIFIQLKDLKSFVDLPNVKLQMLGNHQLKNALTGICTVLCLRDQGWTISEKSIRAGLERTRLLGRSQILTHTETEAVGLPDRSILVDGAHTEASAEGLAGTIKMINPDGRLALVVAMASDKDHKAFAKQLLSGTKPDIVLLTEVSIAGGKFRMASASALKDAWITAAADSHIEVLDIGIIDPKVVLDDRVNYLQSSTDSKSVTLIGCHIAGISDTMKVADQLLWLKTGENSGLITLTGSLHIVAAVLAGADH